MSLETKQCMISVLFRPQFLFRFRSSAEHGSRGLHGRGGGGPDAEPAPGRDGRDGQLNQRNTAGQY